MSVYDNTRENIDKHIFENNKKIDTHTGFTTGSMIEANLFTLQYCIEWNFKFKIPLLITYLNYSKYQENGKHNINIVW